MENTSEEKVYYIEHILGVRHIPNTSRARTLDPNKSELAGSGSYLIPTTVGFELVALEGLKYPVLPERVTFKDNPYEYEIKWVEHKPGTHVVMTLAEFSLWALAYTDGFLVMRHYPDVKIQLCFVEPKHNQLPIMRTTLVKSKTKKGILADYITPIDPQSRFGRGQKEKVVISEQYREKFGYYARDGRPSSPRPAAIEKKKKAVRNQYGDLLQPK